MLTNALVTTKLIMGIASLAQYSKVKSIKGCCNDLTKAAFYAPIVNTVSTDIPKL